jgi:hypothetical protein
MSEEYIALARRSYGEGRISIITDHIGGYESGHGVNSISFWVNLIEWTGQRKNKEKIKIGIIPSIETGFEKYLKTREKISFNRTSLQDISRKNLNYDLLYFIGLPEKITLVAKNNIEEFVRKGGGVLIERPNVENSNINVIESIESVLCYSRQKNNYNFAYWTNDGINSNLYKDDVLVSFSSSLRKSDFSSEWEILMSNIKNDVVKSSDPFLETVQTVSNAISEFSVSFYNAMSHGIVILEEGDFSSSSSSSDLTSSSSSIDSSSSSSVDSSSSSTSLSSFILNELFDSSSSSSIDSSSLGTSSSSSSSSLGYSSSSS